MSEDPRRVRVYEIPRDAIYWQQRCIAAEAQRYSLETEVAHLKSSEKHYQDRSNHWMQKYILAEAKLQQALTEVKTLTPSQHVQRGTKRKNTAAGVGHDAD